MLNIEIVSYPIMSMCTTYVRASNVSFGMPDRPQINVGFLTVASVMGMNCPITDPTNVQMRSALLMADIFQGRDRRTRRYMQFLRQVQSA
ncbi:MAG: hypothetical protein P4L50_27450 [Anaerolineaceae bacterium]|nr:hypothetical protein [Anaerolineaceae bacterium]